MRTERRFSSQVEQVSILLCAKLSSLGSTLTCNLLLCAPSHSVSPLHCTNKGKKIVIKKGFNVTIIDYYYFHRWTAEKGLHVTRSSVSISPHPYYPPLSHGPSTRSSLHPWICGLPLSHSQMQSSGMEKVHPTITGIAKCFDLNLIFFLPSFNFFVCHISKGWITNLSRQTLQIY